MRFTVKEVEQMRREAYFGNEDSSDEPEDQEPGDDQIRLALERLWSARAATPAQLQEGFYPLPPSCFQLCP